MTVNHLSYSLIKMGVLLVVIESEQWLKMTTSFEKSFKSLVGNPSLMDTAIALMGQKRRAGIKNCEALLT